MARSIHQMAHDLKPILQAVEELSDAMKELLLNFYENEEIKNQECIDSGKEVMDTLKSCATLALTYINEVEIEAKNEGIEKHY